MKWGHFCLNAIDIQRYTVVTTLYAVVPPLALNMRIKLGNSSRPLRLLPSAGAITQKKRKRPMMTLILNSLVRLRKDESAQGLVEYLLILALIAFAATAGMSSLASGLNSAFSTIGLVLGSYIT